MRNYAIFCFILLSTLLLAACAPAAAPAPSEMDMTAREAPSLGAPAEVSGNVFSQAGGEVIPGVTAAQADRLVIKNGSLSIVVDDPVRSLDNITRLADELGGFVVSANLSETFLDSGASVPQANITIRVPAQRFTEALGRIKEETTQLPQYENIDSQDVTGDYTDLASRLRNLEAAEAQLTEIMDDAIRTEDVLSVYNQLVQVREQIEVIKGQMQYYEESAAMSLISVELVANAAVQPLTIAGWQPVGTARNAVQALIDTLEVLGDIVIWLVILVIPVLLVLYLIFVLPLRLLWRAWRRRQGKGEPRSMPAAPPAQPSE
jgi:hypothetical protein